MKSRRETLQLVMAGSLATIARPTLAAPKGGGGGGAELGVPIIAPVTDAATGTALGQLGGIFSIESFAVQNGVATAVGTVKGKVTSLTGATGVLTSTGSAVTAVSSAATMAVTSSGTCTVLTLTLGPLDLTLLGLHIHLNEVVLTIDANPAGGLLGQLLCALAGGTALDQLVNLLNQLLALLGSV